LVKLFAGKVNFSQRELKEVKKMLREVSDRQGLVLRLLSMRGRVDSFERSSLDDYRLLTDQEQSSGNGGQKSGIEVIELDDSSDEEEEEMEKLEKAGKSKLMVSGEFVGARVKGCPRWILGVPNGVPCRI
jgi:hypothetical protein